MGVELDPRRKNPFVRGFQPWLGELQVRSCLPIDMTRDLTPDFEFHILYQISIENGLESKILEKLKRV